MKTVLLIVLLSALVSCGGVKKTSTVYTTKSKQEQMKHKISPIKTYTVKP